MTKKLLTVSELAKKFNLNKSHVFYLRQKGIIKESGVIGKALFFDQSVCKKLEKHLNNKSGN